jgi:hypothetical protein
MAIASTGIGEGIMEIAMALAGIALVALILNRSKDAATLIKTAGSTYNQLLTTVINPGSMSAGFTPMAY